LMFIRSLIFSSIRLRFSFLVLILLSESFFTKYSSFFIRFRSILRFSINVRLNFFSLVKFSSSSLFAFLRMSISFWYSWWILLICSRKVLYFLMVWLLSISMMLPSYWFYLFQSIFKISALFLDVLATCPIISLNPAAIKVCLF
jgi:hypothetical protein